MQQQEVLGRLGDRHEEPGRDNQQEGTAGCSHRLHPAVRGEVSQGVAGADREAGQQETTSQEERLGELGKRGEVEDATLAA